MFECRCIIKYFELFTSLLYCLHRKDWSKTFKLYLLAKVQTANSMENTNKLCVKCVSVCVYNVSMIEHDNLLYIVIYILYIYILLYIYNYYYIYIIDITLHTICFHKVTHSKLQNNPIWMTDVSASSNTLEDTAMVQWVCAYDGNSDSSQQHKTLPWYSGSVRMRWQ